MNLTSQTVLIAGISEDMPRSFLYTQNNETLLSGPYAESVKNFGHYMGMKLILRIREYVPSVSYIYKDIVRGYYNISSYSSVYGNTTELVQHSYPVGFSHKCIMVPQAKQIPKYLYIIRPYGPYIWISLLLGTIYIAILMRYIEGTSPYTPARSIVRNIPHALNISLYTMNMQVNLKNAPFRVLLFYTLLFLYGFILSAYHQPYMTAYCMKPYFVKPLSTVQEILNANLKIIVTTHDLRELQNNKYANITPLDPILRNVTSSEFDTLIKNLNRSFAYMVTRDQWEFISRQQQNLMAPYFHQTQLCYSPVLRSIPIMRGWKYARTLDVFLQRVQQAGLWTQWVNQAFARAVIEKKAKILLDTHPIEALNLESCAIGWVVLAVGLMISFIIALFEYIIWKCRDQLAVIKFFD